MYVGLVAMLLSWAVWLAAPWVSMGPPAVMVYLLRFQILSEERLISSKFGRDCDEYWTRVRPWL